VPSILLFFHRDRYGPVRRQAYHLPFDVRDQPQIDKVMMAFVASFTAVGLGEPDPAVLDALDSSNMNAVRSDDFHMPLDLVTAAHFLHSGR